MTPSPYASHIVSPRVQTQSLLTQIIIFCQSLRQWNAVHCTGDTPMVTDSPDVAKHLPSAVEPLAIHIYISASIYTPLLKFLPSLGILFPPHVYLLKSWTSSSKAQFKAHSAELFPYCPVVRFPLILETTGSENVAKGTVHELVDLGPSPFSF